MVAVAVVPVDILSLFVPEVVVEQSVRAEILSVVAVVVGLMLKQPVVVGLMLKCEEHPVVAVVMTMKQTNPHS